MTQPANGTVVITSGGADLTYQPERQLLQHSARHDPRHVHLHADTGGSTATVIGDGDLCRRPAGGGGRRGDGGRGRSGDGDRVLANDTDVDGGPISIASVIRSGQRDRGGHRRRDRADLSAGPELLQHAAGDDAGHVHLHARPGGSTATVTVTVTCVAEPPVAVDDAATVAEDAAATAIDVLANDIDADGGPISIASATQPANGTVVVTGGGTGLTYQPDANYCNTQVLGPPDTFTYTLTAGRRRRCR